MKQATKERVKCPGRSLCSQAAASNGSRWEKPRRRDPGPGEIKVRLHANSLNYHDYAVVSGMWGPQAPRIPMADGAGEVTAVGPGVSEFSVGDAVVSTFFPDWLDGEPTMDSFAAVPGDGLDGYARENVTASAQSFTHAPKGFSPAEAATLTTAGLTAWRALHDDGRLKAGETVLVQGTGGVSIFALQFAKMAGATRHRHLIQFGKAGEAGGSRRRSSDQLPHRRRPGAKRRASSPADAASIMSSRSAVRRRWSNR